MAALRGLVEALEALQVDNARAKGWSWQDIAGRLGVTKQAVHQKHGPPRPVGAREVTAMVRFTEEAGIVPHFAREEAERRYQYYLGPEHLLLGLLVGDENPMVTGLREHGVDLKVGDDNPAAACYARMVWILRPCGPGSTGWLPRASSPVPAQRR